MKRLATSCAAAALALSTLGCASMVSKLRPDFAEATTDDAAVLTIVPAPGNHTNFLSGVRDPVKCEGALNLAGSMQLDTERRVRLPPSKEFAFAVDLFQHLGVSEYHCEVMVIFTPEARGEYRATVLGTALSRCGIRLTKVVAGTEIEETTARRRRMDSRYGWKCVD